MLLTALVVFFFFSSRRRHTRWNCDWSSDVCSSDLAARGVPTGSSGTLTDEIAVYRASATGIERLFGDGDVVSNGDHIDAAGDTINFVANAKGSVLAQTLAGGGEGLFLRHGGRLDLVRYGTPPAQWGLADNDDVVMLDSLDEGLDTGSGPPPANALLVSRNAQTRVLARASDATLPGGPWGTFGSLMVRGDLVMFSAFGG